MSRIKELITFGFAILILVGVFCIVASAVPELSKPGGGSWKYQRDMSIKENSGTTLIDYQVLVELKGADFPGEAASGGTDIRFTDSRGKELSYWIENWDYAGRSARIWVKIPGIQAGSTATVRMYYGNPSATSASSGTNTFVLFDDFNRPDGAVDNGWTVSGSHVSVFSNYLKAYTTTTFNDPVSKPLTILNAAWEWKVRFPLVPRFDMPDADFTRIVYDGTNYYNVYIRNSPTYNEYYLAYDHENIIISNTWTPDTAWHTVKVTRYNGVLNLFLDGLSKGTTTDNRISTNAQVVIYPLGWGSTTHEVDWDDFRVRKYASPEPTVTLKPPEYSSITLTKSASPYSIRQFQETEIKIHIENTGTTDATALEIMDSIHPNFDLTDGDFPNPKKFEVIHAGETRELQYVIRAKESGTFTLEPATVTYADRNGNIQEAKSEPVSISVFPSSEGVNSQPGTLPKSASVSLHGEKTNVVLGEDILFRLSAVNLITKPNMHVQVILIPPSGMSVTSSEFSKVAAGQFTANYELAPGDGRDIEVRIRSNQVGDFNVNGRIIYYFGDEKDKAEDYTLNLPIKVRKEPGELAPSNPTPKEPGFKGELAIIGILFVALLVKRYRAGGIFP